MPPVSEVLALALERHRSGRLEEARRLYGAVLDSYPEEPDALHLLGMLEHREGNPEAALGWLRRAVAASPDTAAFHNGLGLVLSRAGRHDEAERALRRALAIEPGFAAANINLAGLLIDRGRPSEAIAACEGALRADPHSAQARNNLGSACLALGRWEDARRAFTQALEASPGFTEASVNLAAALAQLGQAEDAARLCREASQQNPQLVQPWLLQADLAEESGRHEQAEAFYREALARDPVHSGAWCNLGGVLRTVGRFEEAEACCARALALRPEDATARANLGAVYTARGRFAEAASCYEQALALDPECAHAHCNRALLLLLTGHWREGWKEYEWRWKKKGTQPRAMPRPEWSGGPVCGRTVLLWAEQGLGDTLQFVRYARLVEALGARVVVECQPPLVSLIGRVAGVDAAVPAGAALPPFDAHAPLLSLPRLFGSTPETVPAGAPYIHADIGRIAGWRDRLAACAGLRVGLAWAGNPQHVNDRLRSLPPERLRRLAEVAGVDWFGLAPGRAAWADAPFHVMPEGSGIEETAALTACLDLVISVDTMCAHLAGAMGKPVWVVLSFAPDWRWLLDRPDTPWYPTMRLFRQRQPGAWEAVLEEVARELAAKAANHAQARRGQADKESGEHESPAPVRSRGEITNRM